MTNPSTDLEDHVDDTQINTIQIQWWGEEGDWLATPGHIDLDLFTAAANREFTESTGDPEPLSADFKAEHKWFILRPLESDDSDEAYFPCDPGTPNALAFTIIETGV